MLGQYFLGCLEWYVRGYPDVRRDSTYLGVTLRASAQRHAALSVTWEQHSLSQYRTSHTDSSGAYLSAGHRPDG
eukprot:702141-Rhodomonas_salina.1